MKNKYKIADLVIKVHGYHDRYLKKAMSAYVTCKCKKHDITINYEKISGEIKNNYNSFSKVGEAVYCHCGENYDTFIFYDEIMGKIIAEIVFDKSYTSVNITLCNLKKLYGIADDKFLFNIVGVAMHYIIRMNSGFVLHSSAISVSGRGIAFSAQSGVGKSTHTSLWVKHIPDTVIINDDTPIVRLDSEGNAYIYGTPWAGTCGINTNKKVPLEAIVFISRADINSIHKISSFEAIKLFFDAIRPCPTKEILVKTYDTLNSLLTKTGVYLLSCNTECEAVFVASKEILE